jgi:integrase
MTTAAHDPAGAPALDDPGAPALDDPGAPAHDATATAPAITPADAAAPAEITAADRQAVARLLRGEAVPPHLLQLIAGPIGRAVAAAADYAAHALGPATLAAYAADWADFRDWCRAGGIAALPAHPVIVAAYLGSLGETLKRSGLKRRLAAIAHYHRAAGHAWTPGHPAVRHTLRGILQLHGTAVRPSAALTSEEVRRLIEGCGSDLAGVRDRALLLIGFAGALRRSELVGIAHEDLRFTDAGLVLTLPRSKTDPEGEGASLGIPRYGERDTCPVRALDAWLRRSGIQYGRVFRKVSAAGRLEAPLTADGVWKILRRRAAAAGLTVHASERLSPHGLRAGFITEAYLRGALDEQVMHHARHADINTTRGYRRRAKLLTDSPAKLLDL